MKTLRQFVEEAKQFDIEEELDLGPDPEEPEDEDDQDLDEEASQLDEITDDELNDYIAKGGKITIGKPGKMPHKPGLGQASRHIGGGRGAPGRRGSGKAANTNGSKLVVAKEEATVNTSLHEEHDIELKPHPTKKTHYLVHKISKKSGIKSDQLKVGEALNDTHVDDLNDMGYSVKIHNK